VFQFNDTQVYTPLAVAPLDTSFEGQMFSFINGDYPDTFKIRNQLSGLVVDLYLGSYLDNAEIIQHTPNSVGNTQNFYVQSVDPDHLDWITFEAQLTLKYLTLNISINEIRQDSAEENLFVTTFQEFYLKVVSSYPSNGTNANIDAGGEVAAANSFPSLTSVASSSWVNATWLSLSAFFMCTILL
jgi:hypothetical protein